MIDGSVYGLHNGGHYTWITVVIVKRYGDILSGGPILDAVNSGERQEWRRAIRTFEVMKKRGVRLP